MAVNLTDIFFKNLEAYEAKHNLIINQGSTGSSKTWSVLQLLYTIAKFSEEGLVISDCQLRTSTPEARSHPRL